MCSNSKASTGLSYENKAASPGIQPHTGLELKKLREYSEVLIFLFFSKEKKEVLLNELRPYFKSNDLSFGFELYNAEKKPEKNENIL